MDAKERIARRVARELTPGSLVNLGIGLPTLVGDYLPEGVEVLFQSENGLIGLGPAAAEGDADLEVTNAGGMPVTLMPGGCYFDSSLSFGIIRGGHLDATVLGALEVDQAGNLANWMVPGKMVPGMGGAMDLVTGAKRVIIAMQHTAKGEKKILKQCRLPLTAPGVVDLIVTELAVMDITPEGIRVLEMAPDVTRDAVQEMTEAELIFADDVQVME